MERKAPTLLSWSSGKDCAVALHRLRQSKEFEVRGLFTTLNRAHKRVAMHAVSDHLLRLQAKAIGLDLLEIDLPDPCSPESYGEIMAAFLERVERTGIERIAFGDLFLEEVRRYREEAMRGSGIEPLFPLWGISTQDLSRELIRSGFRMYVTCVDSRVMPREFAGREYDKRFISDLPEGVDPCGENGEFHTFVFDGPIFRRPLSVLPGQIVERDGYIYADIVEGGIGS